MDKPTLKLKFCDFWPNFNPRNNFFTNLLSKDFNIIISDEPDILFFSNFGFQFLKYSCPRIYYTGENSRPNYKICDFSLSFESDSGKNLKLPLYVLDYDMNLLRKPIGFRLKQEKKLHFCNMVVSNSKCKVRNKFFELLCHYKIVDSGGKYKNNVGYRVEDKMEFISKYKFSLAFENSSTNGYTTEKIVQPMLVGSIPIYWGNPLIHEEFNTKSFINLHDFQNQRQAIEYIIEVDKNEKLYNQMLDEPFLNGGKFEDCQNLERIKKLLVSNIDKLVSKSLKRLPLSVLSDDCFVLLRRLKYHKKQQA